MNTEVGILRIFLLGGFRLEYEGRPIDIPRRESLLRLFARLLLESDHPLPRKRLAYSVWPDTTEAQALTNLRRHLYLIRQLLPPAHQEQLIISPRTITWKSSPLCWLDVADFERATDDPSALEAAASLYRGDLIGGVDVDETLLARREELRNHYFDLLKTLARRWMEIGEHERGLGWIRKLTALEPWDEEAARLKMALEYRSGNRPAAIATYQTLLQSLDEELGTLPLPETMSLYTDILNNRLPRPAQGGKIAVQASFTSRQSELEQVASSLRSLSNGNGRIFFISGPAGVGKTHLLREALRRHQELPTERPPHLLWGACQPPTAGGARPYAPWRQILSAAAPVIAHEKDISAELLNWLLPLVPDLSILRPGLLAPSEPNPGELHAALRQVFHILALRHPLILVIEDTHWADEASLDLLRTFGETCASLPLLLLVTHRSGGETPQLLEIKQSLRRERSSSEIALHPFTPGEIRAFLEAALEMENVSEPLVRDLAAYSGGLPLLLREAADSLLEARRLHYAGDLPPGLREALRLRLDRLEAEPRRMIEAAAILGLSFLERVLQAVLGWESPSYAATLDTLLARRLLVNAQSTGQDDYAFSHRSIQEVILGEITEERAAELHAAAARALEELYGESMGHADEIARHYESAGQPIQAASHWLRHAEDVTDVSAYGLALEIIAHAVELAGGSAETRQLPAQAALQRAAIAHNQGQLDQVPALLQSALALCIDYPRLYCKALFFQAHVFFTGDHWQEGRQSASQAIALARASGDSLIEGRALHIRALCDMMLGRTAAAAEDLESALSRLEGAGQSKSILYARNLNHLGTALTFMQAYPRAVQALEQAIAMAKAAGLKRLEALALAMLGQVALNRGRYAEAIANYSRSIEVLGGSYIPGLWGKYAGRGLAYLRCGDVHAARTDFERGLEIGMQINSLYARTLMQYYLVCVALAREETPCDLPSLVEIEDAAAEGQIHAVVSQAGEVGGQGWRRLGKLERAIQTHERSLRAAEATQVPLFILGAKIQLLHDRLLLAVSEELLRELDGLIEQVRDSGELPVLTRGLLAKADALLHDRRAAEALPCIEEGLSLAHACPDKPLIAEANYLLAAAQFQLGDSAHAGRALAQARSIAQESAWPLLIQIELLEAQTGKQAAETTEYRKTLLKLLGDTTEKKAVTPSV